MKALIDGDIIRYELGFAAEAGWKHITQSDETPPWRYVRELLDARLDYICDKTGCDEYQLYITEGHTFRFDLAKTKPYKGTRAVNKPWHFDNLTVHLKDVKNAQVVTGIEADDQLAIDHLRAEPGTTVLCSRDKDLRQVPGLFYSWELGKQPAYGPVDISLAGDLVINDRPLKLSGTGFAFFAAQVLMGDPVDNIPGLPGCGPRAAYDTLRDCRDPAAMTDALVNLYKDDELLLEQGRLCWVTRRLHEDGKPVLWEIGMTE